MMTGPCRSPVLLIVWNRPEETREVLRAIRAARPTRLHVAGDGPRDADDARAIAEVRAVVEAEVDWDCEVRTSYSEVNLGCRRGVTRAIDWFFSEVEEGIILEDDCVAHPDFFGFCDEMLARYRSDPRVMHVAGDNTADIAIQQDWSYCFVRYPHIWGWATWRRAWELYDRDLATWDAVVAAGQQHHVLPDQDERETWVPILDALRATGRPDTWDWQWSATCMVRDALCVQPTVNLISNIGFNDRGTHTRSPSRRAAAPVHPILPLRHPTVVHRHRDAERQLFLNTQAGLRARPKVKPWRKRIRRLRGRVRGRLSSLRPSRSIGRT